MSSETFKLFFYDNPLLLKILQDSLNVYANQSNIVDGGKTFNLPFSEPKFGCANLCCRSLYLAWQNITKKEAFSYQEMQLIE